MGRAKVVGIAVAVMIPIGMVQMAAPTGAGVITRVSVASDGTEGDLASRDPEISGDGRYVAFRSTATNLVTGDTNGLQDVFLHDLLTGQTVRFSVSSDGTQGNGLSKDPSVNADGSLGGFVSTATNLVTSDTNGLQDVFLRDFEAGITERISVASDGTQGNGDDHGGDISISADGRYVVFGSNSSNLVPGDTNSWFDTFLRDRQLGTTTRVSVSSTGAQGTDGSYRGNSMSANGLLIAFGSYSPNLVPGDTNDAMDIFVHDRVTLETTRVSIATDGTQGNGLSYTPRMTPDGRFVTFWSASDNLVAGDTNEKRDIFVHDRMTGETERVSVATDGTQGDDTSQTSGISGDGRFVAFRSKAANLVPADTNGTWDVFIHDRSTSVTTRLSVNAQGDEANDWSYLGGIDHSGTLVAFDSMATNLVENDTNGDYDVFVTLVSLLFSDGFESGDTSAWSNSVP